MDRIDISKKILELLGRYKYALLILGIGILLMSFPTQKQAPAEQKPIDVDESPITRTEELENILGQISGVGKVDVLLTEAAGEQKIYQTDEDQTKSTDTESRRIETVIVTNSSREETGLIRSVTPPVYLGAIIVCQGGDRPAVRLAVVQAVSNVTGISSERISVLKMK